MDENKILAGGYGVQKKIPATTSAEKKKLCSVKTYIFVSHLPHLMGGQI